MSAAEPVAQLRAALDAVGRVVDGVRDEQWAQPTPCSEWSVRELLNHLVFGNLLFADTLAGAPPLAPEELAAARGRDVLGADPAAAYRAAAAGLVAAFERPGALEAPVTVPVGTLPGAVALQLRVTEALAHGWDLARATGGRLDVPDDVVEVALGFTARMPTPQTPRPSGWVPFAAPQVVDPAAPALDRLAAALGRDVGRWG